MDNSHIQKKSDFFLPNPNLTEQIGFFPTALNNRMDKESSDQKNVNTKSVRPEKVRDGKAQPFFDSAKKWPKNGPNRIFTFIQDHNFCNFWNCGLVY